MDHMSEPPNKRDILIVEDSNTQANLLKALLEQNGYHVRHAFDGIDAINEVERERPNLIISDIEMPRLNGYKLAGLLRQDKRFL